MEPNNVVVENMVVKELLLPPRELPNKPRRLRDLTSAYPVDEQNMLLEAVGKYLREAVSPPPDLGPIITPDTISTASAKPSTNPRTLPLSPPPSGAPPVALHTVVTTEGSDTEDCRVRGSGDGDGCGGGEPALVESPARSPLFRAEISSSEVSSSTSSPLSAAGDSETAYYADDSDASRHLCERIASAATLVCEACTDDEAVDSMESSVSTSCNSSTVEEDSAPGGGGEQPWRPPSRLLRSVAMVQERNVNAIHQDGDDHNYSLASRSLEEANGAARNRRWTRSLKSNGGGEAKSITWRMRKARIQPF